MRVLVWGINYAPEVTGIAPCNTALCDFLKARGHHVRMLTSFCYYPAWRKLPADVARLYRTDDHAGVAVHRCWHYVPARVTTLRRIFHELSFVATSLVRAFTLPRPDVLVVVSPPLLLGPAAWLVSKLRRCPFVFHVQDLQPDAASRLGLVKLGGLLKLLYAVEAFAYRHAARVGGISQGMLQAFRRKNVPPEKLLAFPNAISLSDYDKSAPAPGVFRRKYGFTAEDFLVVYSGNLGVKQGLPLLLAAAAQLKDPRIKLIICGDGNQRANLADQIDAEKLTNVCLLPLLPQAEYLALLRDTNLYAITQQPGTGQICFPSKLLPALAMAKPILAVGDEDSELVRVVKQGQFGLALTQPDAPALARLIEQARQSLENLETLGQAGRRHVGQFDHQLVFPAFEKVLASLLRP